MHQSLYKSNSQEPLQNNPVTQRQTQPGDIQSKEGQKSPIQAKQKPIQAKHKPIQAKHRPVQRNAGRSARNGNAHEAQVKANVSALTGTNVNDAKVHYNSNQPAQLQAEATAQGNQVHLASGKEQHLGHELTHIAQQKQGRVQANFQANNGVGINNDPTLEKEADDIGAQAQSNQPIQAKSVASGNNPTTNTTHPMQLKLTDGKVKGKKPVGVHKSNFKKYNGKGTFLFVTKPTQIMVSSRTKATLKPGDKIKYDPQVTDASGKYVKVAYESNKVEKTGFVELAYIEKIINKEEIEQKPLPAEKINPGKTEKIPQEKQVKKDETPFDISNGGSDLDIGQEAPKETTGSSEVAKSANNKVKMSSFAGLPTLPLQKQYLNEKLAPDYHKSIKDIQLTNGKIEFAGKAPHKPYTFVIKTDGTLRIGDAKPGTHFKISDGDTAVKSAGTIQFNPDGHIAQLDDMSGHYRPPQGHNRKTVQAFYESGLIPSEAGAHLDKFDASLFNDMDY